MAGITDACAAAWLYIWCRPIPYINHSQALLSFCMSSVTKCLILSLTEWNLEMKLYMPIILLYRFHSCFHGNLLFVHLVPFYQDHSAPRSQKMVGEKISMFSCSLFFRIAEYHMLTFVSLCLRFNTREH